MRRAGVRLAAGVVLLSALAACGSESSLEKGDTVQAPTQITGTVYEFRVPSGAVTVTVGEPVDRVDSASGEATSAPDGGVLLPVGWALDRRSTAPVTGFDQEAEIAVETGGETVEVVAIPDTPVSSDAVYVAVPGDGTDVSASVTYDGVTQVIGPDEERDAGIAEALYDDGATSGDRQDCSTVDFGLSDADIDCRVQSWVLPYLPDYGWAAAGQTYVLVRPDLALWSVTTGGTRYRTNFVSDASTVDGQAAETRLELGSRGTGSLGGLLTAIVPEADAHVWQVDAEFTLRSPLGGPRDGETVRIRAEVPLQP